MYTTRGSPKKLEYIFGNLYHVILYILPDSDFIRVLFFYNIYIKNVLFNKIEILCITKVHIFIISDNANLYYTVL